MNKFKKADYIRNGYLDVCKKHINSFTNLHSHEFFEMEYILSGSGTYTIDGQNYDIAPGNLYFMTPMNVHTVDIKDAVIYNLMFSGEICNPAYLSSLSAKSPFIINIDTETNSFLCTLFNELILHSEDKMYCQVLLDAVIAKLDLKTENQAKNLHLSYIQQAELYILNNFKNTLTLNDVAEHVGLTPTYFSKLFAAETGQTFKKYVNQMRFEHAKKLLIYSDLTVMQICSECGFQDYPNFVRRFKQHTGEYPLAYKQAQKKR